MTSNELRSDERKALELLPWYVNGTLEGEERELVGRQVLSSLTCRKELERLRRLHELIQHDDAEAAATGRAFERLMARIDASEASTPSRARRIGRQYAWTPFALAASLAAGVSVLMSSGQARHLRDDDQHAAERSGRCGLARRLRAGCHRIGTAGTADPPWPDGRRCTDG